MNAYCSAMQVGALLLVELVAEPGAPAFNLGFDELTGFVVACDSL
jgi:hypothetical protein